jgi:hypothetical protein
VSGDETDAAGAIDRRIDALARQPFRATFQGYVVDVICRWIERETAGGD